MHRLIYAIVVCTLLAPVVSGQGAGDCLIVGAQQVECGSTGTWLGSLPVAVNPYAANWSILSNTTGAAIVGSTGCPTVPVPIGTCPVMVNVGTVGTFTLKLTLTTQAGAMPMCSRIITVVDTMPPVISCPPNINVECGSSTAPAATGTPTAVDCSPVTFSHTDSAGATNCAGTAIIRVWIGTDSSGNVSLPCTQIITIVDTTPPSITCPGPVSVQCFSQVPPPNTGSVTTSDLCGHAVTVIHLGDSASNGTSSCNNVITRTYKATDTCGNMNTCTQLITVNDTTAPSITCPGPVSVQCFSLVPAPNIGSVTTSDNCGGAVTVIHVGDVPSNGTSSCNNVITRTYRATDLCGNMNTCTQLITVNDTTAPSITCPGPVSVQCLSLVPAPNIGSVTTSDNCGGAVTVVHVGDVPSNGTSSCNNVITRTYRGTDLCGNMNTCTQLITVNDTTAPAITCPGPVSVQCLSLVPAPNIGSVTTSDNCGGAVTVVHVGDVPSNGTSSCNNVITRTYRGTDLCGNMNTCTQLITVNDTTAPTLTCPGPVTVQCDSDVPAANTALVGKSDNCGGLVTVTHQGDVPSGTCPKTITRTYVGTDPCGNTGTCTQTITVHDTTAPTLTCPGPVSVQCDSDVPAPNPALVGKSDNCGGVVTVTHQGDVPSGTCPKTITRTYVGTDPCGNTGTCTQTITVNDTIAPVITCPADVTVTGTGCIVVNIGTATATDNCTGMITISNNAPVLFCVGTTTVTWTATDACGNAAHCDQHVTVGGAELCATKFFDENANGVQDPGEPGIPGWKIVVTGPENHTGVTGADGSVCFEVGAGTYTVTEGEPNQTNWVHTTPASRLVTVTTGTSSVSFGNYCFDGLSGGHTLGFWRNNNGQAILQAHDPAWRNLLNGLNLKNATGGDFTVPTGSFTTAFNAWSAYDQGANATNMAYMLSAQLAANVLSSNYFTLDASATVVVSGGMSTAGQCVVQFLSTAQAVTCGATPLITVTNVPGPLGCSCTSNNGIFTISDLQARANCLLGAYPATTGSGLPRTYENLVKDLLDALNNNGGGSCGGILHLIHDPATGICAHTFPN